MQTKFLENVRRVTEGFHPEDAPFMGGWVSVRPTVVPPFKREATVYVALAPSVIIPEGEFIDFSDPVQQIAKEVYGEVCDLLAQYIEDRELDPSAEEELRNIMELMK